MQRKAYKESRNLLGRHAGISRRRGIRPGCPASTAGGAILQPDSWSTKSTATISQAGNTAIPMPRRCGSFATMFGWPRPIPASFSPWVREASCRSLALCSDDGRDSDIMTDEAFGDYQLHLDFTVPKGSNSGV